VTDAARRVLMDACYAARAKRGTAQEKERFMDRRYISSNEDYRASIEWLRSVEYVDADGLATVKGRNAAGVA